MVKNLIESYCILSVKDDTNISKNYLYLYISLYLIFYLNIRVMFVILSKLSL